MKEHVLSWRSKGAWLAVVTLLLLALAACSPGGATNTGSGPEATSTRQPAPINVPQDYQGLILISFDASTTYLQAQTAVESAGLKLQIPCPNAGPIIADATPVPATQTTTFLVNHQLTAVGDPSLTAEMLNQVALQPGVTSVDVLPTVECPLTPGGGA